MKRYDIHGSVFYTQESDDGQYVTYEDAAAIIAQRNEAIRLLRRALNISERFGSLDVGECEFWEYDTNKYLENYKETGP